MSDVMIPIQACRRDAGLLRSGRLAILIHGGGFDQRYFEVSGHALVDHLLARGVDVLSINQPGYGGTPPVSSKSPIADSIASILAHIEAEVAKNDEVLRTNETRSFSNGPDRSPPSLTR